jgi:hypothetical protein
VEARIGSRRAAIRSRVLDTLASLASRAATHALLDEQMVLNEAFLISTDDVPEFEERVRGLDVLFDGRLNFRIVGPVPPYTFSTVEVARVTSQRRKGALGALGLADGELDERAIRAAFRRAVAEAQRRVPAGVPTSGVPEDSLREASELLLDLSQADPADTSRRHGADSRDRWVAKIRTSGLEDISAASFGGGA